MKITISRTTMHIARPRRIRCCEAGAQDREFAEEEAEGRRTGDGDRAGQPQARPDRKACPDPADPVDILGAVARITLPAPKNISDLFSE